MEITLSSGPKDLVVIYFYHVEWITKIHSRVTLDLPAAFSQDNAITYPLYNTRIHA